jgi:hypothetical protein
VVLADPDLAIFDEATAEAGSTHAEQLEQTMQWLPARHGRHAGVGVFPRTVTQLVRVSGA